LDQLQQDHLELFKTPFNKDALTELLRKADNRSDWMQYSLEWTNQLYGDQKSIWIEWQAAKDNI
jgi:hypothetical protein